jgi:hypothetical protein
MSASPVLAGGERGKGRCILPFERGLPLYIARMEFPLLAGGERGKGRGSFLSEREENFRHAQEVPYVS